MIRGILVGMVSFLMAAWMPAALLTLEEPAQPDNRLLMVNVQEEGPAELVQILVDGNVVEMAMEDYLVGVLLGEMPVSFHKEALKAQAVAARTFARKQVEQGKHENYDLCTDSGCCQAWVDPRRIGEKVSVSHVAEAVEETAGQALTYDGEWIDAVYFSCSGGKTEDAVAVWGGEVPYLQSVDSPGEEDALRFYSEVAVPLNDFKQGLPEAKLTGSPSAWFGPIKYTEGGGVREIEIGGRSYSGTELRKRFGLNSTMFQIAVAEEEIIFEVKGFGHRVGMSQYGANAMAQAGESYQKILQHYYPGTSLDKKYP